METNNWELTVFNGDLQWYRVLGDDIDYLEHEKRRAKKAGFDYETRFKGESKCENAES